MTAAILPPFFFAALSMHAARCFISVYPVCISTAPADTSAAYSPRECPATAVNSPPSSVNFFAHISDIVKIAGCDTLVTAVGYESDNRLYDALKQGATPVYLIGDAKEVGKIAGAIRQADKLAAEI